MEDWKPIPDYEGFYEASSLGRVRSVSRYVAHARGGKSLKRSRVLSPWKNNMGYLSVELKRCGIGKKFLVHRLVAAAFFPVPVAEEINHIDFNALNNSVANLEPSDRFSNKAWSVQHGHAHGATNPNRRRKLTPESVSALRAARKGGATYQELAGRFGIHRCTASQIARGTSWARGFTPAQISN